MNEINDEVKLTLNLMQTDIDYEAHSELQRHLACLLEIKRNELQQRLVERSWFEPADGMGSVVKFDQAPYKSVKLEGQVTSETKPLLTSEELESGGWLCTDVSEECANALKSKNLRVFNSDEWGDDGLWVGCVMDDCGDVKRKGIFFDFVGKKQIHRIGNDFYWGDE